MRRRPSRPGSIPCSYRAWCLCRESRRNLYRAQRVHCSVDALCSVQTRRLSWHGRQPPVRTWDQTRAWRVGDYFHHVCAPYTQTLKDRVDFLSFKASTSEDTQMRPPGFEANRFTNTKRTHHFSGRPSAPCRGRSCGSQCDQNRIVDHGRFRARRYARGPRPSNRTSNSRKLAANFDG